MLAVAGRSNIDLAGVIEPAPEVGSSYAVEWVDIDEPDPDVDRFTNDEAIVAVGDQGREKGAAIFSRLEGAPSTTRSCTSRRRRAARHRPTTRIRMGSAPAAGRSGPTT